MTDEMWWSDEDIQRFAYNCWQWRLHHNAETRFWERCQDEYLEMARAALASTAEKARA